MRCDICDRALTDKEVIWNDDLRGFEPCTVCLDIALDAAYGQSRPDDDDVPLLDADFDLYGLWDDSITAPEEVGDEL